MTTILLNILLGLYSALCVTFLVSMVQSIGSDRKRARRDEEREARDKEYHEKRMRDFK
jgi:MFS superfamily sulfate permease-like transporter